jgi:DNA-binding NarL/FixJ family response regulator
MDAWIRNHDDVPVLAFCYACCSEMFLASGEWDQAEGMLNEGMASLEAAGHRSRCVHPAAKLAELRLTQGRLEEAEQLLSGFEELPEAAHGIARLQLLRGESALAAATIHRRLNRIGDDNVLSAPFLAMLVDVQLAQGDRDGATASAERLDAVARRSGLPRIEAAAAHARGRVALASSRADAKDLLEASIARYGGAGMTVEVARARLDLARALEEAQPEVAVGEARTALAEFERLGAPRDADAAAELLRHHGVRGRTGPKDVGLLTRREQEVLSLVAEGLTNAEVAARLHVSTKTVGHHVSNVLAKLGVRSRGEAAAWAMRHLGAAAPGGRA